MMGRQISSISGCVCGGGRGLIWSLVDILQCVKLFLNLINYIVANLMALYKEQSKILLNICVLTFDDIKCVFR